MKIRQGFVSNSSTTSFCIYGVETNEDVWEDAKEVGLAIESFSDYSEYDYAVGLPYHMIQDNETGAEFKHRVQTAIRKIFPDVKDEAFGLQADAYYDG